MTDTDTTASAPLEPADFDAQDAVLDQLRETQEATPEWEYCEGFLTGLVCCRREIAPEDYWPVLLGEEFRPMEHMEFVWRWQRRRQEIEAALDADIESLEDEQSLQPELLDLRGGVLAAPAEQRGEIDLAQVPSYGQMWARGFLYAVQSWPEDWAPPRDKEAAALLEDALEALVILAGPDVGAPALSMHSEDGPPSVSEERLEALGEALWAVYDLRRLWQALGPRTDPLRKAPVPGRNDPCPCGSGKKYKKCHGA